MQETKVKIFQPVTLSKLLKVVVWGSFMSTKCFKILALNYSAYFKNILFSKKTNYFTVSEVS